MTVQTLVGAVLVLWSIGLSFANEVETSAVSQERLRPEQSRTIVNQFYDAEDAKCKTKFAVSGCLKEVSRQRLAKLAEIKAEELKNKDLERASSAQEKQQDLARRASERQSQLQQLSESVSRSPEPPTDSKVQDRQQTTKPVGSSQSKATAEANLTLQSEKRRAYERKQQEAEKRRAEKKRRLSDINRSVRGLPAAP